MEQMESVNFDCMKSMPVGNFDSFLLTVLKLTDISRKNFDIEEVALNFVRTNALN